MSFFDIALLLLIAGFALFGLWYGLVRTVGSLIGTVVGIYVASRYYEPLANWVIGRTGWSENHVRIVIFIASFLLITKLIGLLFWLLGKVLSVFTQIPFVKSIDKILGLVFGALEGAVVIGISLYFIARFPVSLPFMDGLAHSQIAPPLVRVASIVVPLLPEALRVLRSTVDSLI